MIAARYDDVGRAHVVAGLGLGYSLGIGVDTHAGAGMGLVGAPGGSGGRGGRGGHGGGGLGGAAQSPVCTWEEMLHDEVPQSPFGWFAAEDNPRRHTHGRHRSSSSHHHDDDWAMPIVGLGASPPVSPRAVPPSVTSPGR